MTDQIKRPAISPFIVGGAVYASALFAKGAYEGATGLPLTQPFPQDPSQKDLADLIFMSLPMVPAVPLAYIKVSNDVWSNMGGGTGISELSGKAAGGIASLALILGIYAITYGSYSIGYFAGRNYGQVSDIAGRIFS